MRKNTLGITFYTLKSCISALSCRSTAFFCSIQAFSVQFGSVAAARTLPANWIRFAPPAVRSHKQQDLLSQDGAKVARQAWRLELEVRFLLLLYPVWDKS